MIPIANKITEIAGMESKIPAMNSRYLPWLNRLS
jgi:hypothetical protein